MNLAIVRVYFACTFGPRWICNSFFFALNTEEVLKELCFWTLSIHTIVRILQKLFTEEVEILIPLKNLAYSSCTMF
jgi:hypothetical protein